MSFWRVLSEAEGLRVLKKYRLRCFGAILGVLAAGASPVFVALADEATTETVQADMASPDAFVTGLVDKLRILAADKAADAGRIESLRTVLAEDMATRRLQRFLLSKSQSELLSERELAAYDDVFPRYISSAFAGSIDQLVSRTIKVNDVVERRPGDFIVRTKLYSDDGAERAGLDWRILEAEGRKQLVDVSVDGLSFSVERRAQFTAILKKDGFPALIAHMKEVAGEADTES